jgi:hypothetical protein
MDCEALKALQADILNDLAASALGRLGSYSIDGQSVSKERWIAWKFNALGQLNALIQQCEPYEIRTNAAP